MNVAVRSYFTAGVALVGAGVITVSPVAPPLPDIQVPALRTDAVQLSSSAFDLYVQVFEQAVDSAGALFGIASEQGPAPILQQILTNQFKSAHDLATAFKSTAGDVTDALTTKVPPLFESAFNDLRSGNVEGAVNNLLDAVVQAGLPLISLTQPIQDALGQSVQNLLNVVNEITVVALLGGLGAIGPIISGAGVMGAAVQDTIDAVGSGDPKQILNAIVAGPAVVADGVLHGGYGPLLLGAFPAPGLLSPGGTPTSFLPGPVSALLQIRMSIAEALGAPVAFAGPDAAAPTDSSAKTVTVDLAPEATSDETATHDEVPATEVEKDIAAGAEKDTVSDTKTPNATKSSGATDKSDDSTKSGTTSSGTSSDNARTSSTTPKKSKKTSNGSNRSSGADSHKAATA